MYYNIIHHSDMYALLVYCTCIYSSGSEVVLFVVFL